VAFESSPFSLDLCGFGGVFSIRRSTSSRLSEGGWLMTNIFPAFDLFPDEARLIGRILASFGDLEFAVCRNADAAVPANHNTFTALYQITTTSLRINTAFNLASPLYKLARLDTELNYARAAVQWCLTLRNQYAHCNWAYDQSEGLFFADLKDSIVLEDTSLFHNFRHIDVPLLSQQLEYFKHAYSWLDFVSERLGFFLRGKSSQHSQAPTKLAQPPSYNPPEEHTPPWISESQKDLHRSMAAARTAGLPTPTPAHKAMHNERVRKRAEKSARDALAKNGEKKKADSSPTNS
jgi:hypothetical protein